MQQQQQQHPSQQPSFWQRELSATQEILRSEVANARAFLRQPPRWFIWLGIVLALGVVLSCTLMLTGAVASQAQWLRNQLP